MIAAGIACGSADREPTETSSEAIGVNQSTSCTSRCGLQLTSATCFAVAGCLWDGQSAIDAGPPDAGTFDNGCTAPKPCPQTTDADECTNAGPYCELVQRTVVTDPR